MAAPMIVAVKKIRSKYKISCTSFNKESICDERHLQSEPQSEEFEHSMKSVSMVKFPNGSHFSRRLISKAELENVDHLQNGFGSFYPIPANSQNYVQDNAQCTLSHAASITGCGYCFPLTSSLV
jgi:hypothetical protein